MGQLICSGVMEAINAMTSEWAYKVPFACQWLWPVPLFILIWMASESPWWLVRKANFEEANNSLNSLTDKSLHETNKRIVAMMIHTDELEKAEKIGTSYLDCFKGTDLRRTEICCMAFAIQVIGGNGFGASYAVYFFEQAGLASSQSYKLALGVGAMAFLAAIISWVVTSYFGRRTILYYGLWMQCIVMLIIGCVSGPCFEQDGSMD